MRSLSKLLALPFALATIFVPTDASAQLPASPSGRVVLVLPFENRSGNATLNWIGDSFPDTLNKRLTSAAFLTISRDDRAFAFDHLGLPEGFKPSRATTIKIAQQLDANFVVIGSFNVTNDKISIQSQILSVDDLRLSAPIQDSADLNRLFDAENAIAWKIARSIDPNFNVAEQTFLAAPGAVSLPAFEDYIRGTTATTPSERTARLKAAIGLAPDYAAALLALGKQQYTARDYTSAAATLAKVSLSNRLALEANFYLGLARFNSANYAGAEQAFAFVVGRLPLPEVVNDQAVAMARQNKDAAAVLFQRAVAADPSDEDYHYNLAISLFRRGDTAAAIREAEAALKLKPADNEAVELRNRLTQVPAGTRLNPTSASSFSPIERIIRTYSEAGFRQAAFQIDQVRALRLAMLPPAERAAAYTQSGRDYLAQGLLPEAEGEFQSAISADPNSADAHAGLASVREGSNNPSQARDEALISLKLHPNAPAWLILARLDLAENQLPIAAGDVSKALQLEPSNSAAMALRQILRSRGQSVP
jgi:tetratricopeptide (TPR) repeat protein